MAFLPSALHIASPDLTVEQDAGVQAGGSDEVRNDKNRRDQQYTKQEQRQKRNHQ